MRLLISVIIIVCIFVFICGCTSPIQSGSVSSMPALVTDIQSSVPALSLIAADKAQELDKIIRRYAEDNEFSVVLVYHSGSILINNGYGFADYDSKEQNNPETRFFLASITKSFTAVAIMKKPFIFGQYVNKLL